MACFLRVSAVAAIAVDSFVEAPFQTQKRHRRPCPSNEHHFFPKVREPLLYIYVYIYIYVCITVCVHIYIYYVCVYGTQAFQGFLSNWAPRGQHIYCMGYIGAWTLSQNQTAFIFGTP